MPSLPVVLRSVQATADDETTSILADKPYEHGAVVRAGTWGGSTSAAIQVSADDTNWAPLLYSDGTAVAFTANGFVPVYKNLYYRLFITSYTGSATLFLDLVRIN